MGKYTHGPLTYKAGGTIPGYSAVKFDGNGDVVVCTGTSTDQCIGITGETAYVVGDYAVVFPLTMEGTLIMTAAEILVLGEDVFMAAAGEVGDLPASGATVHRRLGMCLEAATAQGDQIEVMPDASGRTITAPV